MKLALKRERFYRFFPRNSSFRIPFYCVFLWAVEWIHESLTATFSQPMFLANIRTALFEKERERKSPQGWRLVKSREFEGKFRFNGSYALHSVSLHSVSHSVSLNGLYPLHRFNGSYALHAIPAVPLTILDNIARTENFEKKFWESSLVPRAYLIYS